MEKDSYENKKIHSSNLTESFFKFGNGKVLFITFSPMRTVLPPGEIWGQKLFEKFDFPAVGLVSKKNHWYPSEDTIEHIENILPIIDRYDRVILYGYSMGGFAAIKYSKSLKADSVIALSPQVSIDHRDVGGV